jgi:hypothetical protein
MKDEGSDVISVDFHLVGTFPNRLIFRNGGSTKQMVHKQAWSIKNYRYV